MRKAARFRALGITQSGEPGEQKGRGAVGTGQRVQLRRTAALACQNCAGGSCYWWEHSEDVSALCPSSLQDCVSKALCPHVPVTQFIKSDCGIVEVCTDAVKTT